MSTPNDRIQPPYVESPPAPAYKAIPIPPLMGDVRIAAGLGVVSALAVVALVPYLMQVMPGRFADLPVPVSVLVAAQALQVFVLMGLLSLAGLRMGHRVGLGAPLLQHWFNGMPAPRKGSLRPLNAVTAGVLAGAAILALAALIDPSLPPMINPPAQAEAGQSAINGFLASFYGGIVEELQLRLFLMTLVVWLVAKLRKAAPGPATYWGAILFAALLFGAGHLPAAHQIWGLDTVVIIRTVLLNSVAAVVFGWLYWKRGLEMAIVAHFSLDIVLHVLAPLLGLDI